MSNFREKFNTSDFLKVVCIGDIQTMQPYGRPSWSDWLQRALLVSGEPQTSWRRQVFNTAVSRATPKHVATYFTQYAAQFKPDVVLLSFGVSPMFPEFIEKDFSGELDALLDTFERNGIPVALWSPYPLLSGENREITLTLSAMYKQKAVARGLQFIDLYHDFDEIELSKIFTFTVVTKNELFQQEIGKPDSISLNGSGQYMVAKRMANDLFKIALPSVSEGDFIVPNMEAVKSWG